MSDLLVIFDVDGTLVDGQAQIVGAMTEAFTGLGLPVPMRATILTTVGLSLPETFARLAADHDVAVQLELLERYKTAFFNLHSTQAEGGAPLYAGVKETLAILAETNNVYLGIATGKSRRGLRHMLDEHGLNGVFHTLHPADLHPSKPHPAMIAAALADVGLEPAQAVMVGDTSYDMDMARYAKVAGIGVDWGYHPPGDLIASGAETVLSDFSQLIPHLQKTGRLP